MSRIQFYLLLSIIAASLCTKCNDPVVSDDYKDCMDRDKQERGEVCCLRESRINGAGKAATRVCESMQDIFTGQYYNSHELMDYYRSTGGYEYLYFRCSDDDFEEFDIGDNYCNEAKPAESYKECRDRILSKGENCCFGQYQLKGKSKKEDFCISMMTKDGRAYKAQEIYDAYKDKYSKKGIAFDSLYIKCGDKDAAGNKAFELKYSLVLLALVFAILI